VGIARVRYRRCVTLNVSQEGLWLWVRAPLSRHPAVLIPWEEVKQVQGTRLYGQGATELSVGSPEVGRVTVYARLFEAMQRYVRGTQ
jgi:hypothetical protein